MADLLGEFLNAFMSNLPLIIFVVAIIVIVIVIISRMAKKKEDDFKKPASMNPEIEAKKLFKRLINAGTKLRYKCVLEAAQIPKGRILRWTYFYFDRNQPISEFIKQAKKNLPEAREMAALVAAVRAEKRNKKISKEKDKQIFPDDNFYLAEICNLGFFSYFKALLGFGKQYHFLDKSFTALSRNWSIPLTAQSWSPFGWKDVYVYSSEGKTACGAFIREMTLGQVLKEESNYIAFMHYFDFKTGRTVAKLREAARIKTESFRKREAKFGGETPVLDEEEEEY